MKVRARRDINEKRPGEVPVDARLDLRGIFQHHGQFVWLSLQRLGVRPADVDDVAQDVFVIVHRRLGSFDPRTRLRTWLFGICMRVAANYRRRRRWTHEVQSGGTDDDRPGLVVLADEALIRREEQHLAERALSRLDVAKRAIFVMFEIEGLTCNEIAELTNIPVGTVYSRLHAARRQLEKVLARSKAQAPRWREGDGTAPAGEDAGRGSSTRGPTGSA